MFWNFEEGTAWDFCYKLCNFLSPSSFLSHGCEASFDKKVLLVSLFFFFSFELVLLYFHPDLTLNTEGAAKGGAHVSTDASLDVVLVSRLAAQQEGGRAGEETPKEAAEKPGFV